ncbi:hypothetical protein JTZ10_21810 [Gordonia rubripertincta]|uniref:Uncharacterized protein n=1 Tax=Gordonia rubripertincta TaxID=36822 RepID=A0AAW4GB99_GORRU|nr:hypothetical protein [Gordonia rubripertincta]MBM7280385.1 hypothetical protein [Gordonia rubripertincta]
MKLPAAPHYRTRRPRTKERLMATGTLEVSGSVTVHARLGVEFAEQTIQTGQSASVSFGAPASASGVVSGSCVVRARYTLSATSGADVVSDSDAREHYDLEALQDATINGSVDTGMSYSLPATQNINTTHTIDARPTIKVAAAQSFGVAPTAGTVPSVGSVNADATQSFDVDSAANVRARYPVDASQSIVTGDSTVLGGIHIPVTATQTATMSQSAAADVRYTYAATQAIGTASFGLLAASLAAASSTAVTGSGTTRPRHTVDADSSATSTSTATTNVVTIKRQRVNLISEVFNPAANNVWGDIANWASDPTFPATVNAGKKMVVTGGGTVTATINYRMNTVANTASTVRLTVNGVAVATFPDRLNDGDFVDTATITVVAGDVIDLQFKRTVTGSNSLQTPSFIDITPA